MTTEHDKHRERMRRRVDEFGMETLLDHEILEYILYFAIPRGDTNQQAHRLLQEFGSLAGVFAAQPHELLAVRGMGPKSARLVSSYRPVLRAFLQSQLGEHPRLNTGATAAAYARALFFGQARESFYLLCLDAKCRLRRAVFLGSGTVDEVTVYPREAVAEALKNQAKFVLLAHNHPAGGAAPSMADTALTGKLIAAFSGIDILLLDHLIIAHDGVYSFAQAGNIRAVGGVYDYSENSTPAAAAAPM